MAEKRMFSMQIIDSDSFLDMPLSTQALYFHLNMRADDDGFLNNANKIMKMINASKNDYDLLVAKSFIIEFPDGICVIKHWRINNYIRKDRYHETHYTEELEMLTVKKNGAYSLSVDSVGIPDGNQVVTESRVEKNRVEENRVDNAGFDFNSAFNKIFEIYPKQKNFNSAQIEYVHIIEKFLYDPEIARWIYKAVNQYVKDYKEQNPDDDCYKYLPTLDKFLKEDCEHMMIEMEKKQNG